MFVSLDSDAKTVLKVIGAFLICTEKNVKNVRDVIRNTNTINTAFSPFVPVFILLFSFNTTKLVSDIG